MTEEQYWDKDSCLPKYYREADALRNDKSNQLAWLQGMYFYDALASVAPIFNSNSKGGTRARPYVKEAYPITKRATEEQSKQTFDKGKRLMERLMLDTNKKFNEPER